MGKKPRHGEGRSFPAPRVEQRNGIPAKPSAEPPKGRVLVFPEYVRNTVGSEAVQFAQDLYAKLQEYDAIVENGEMPVHEVLEYLDGIGLIEEADRECEKILQTMIASLEKKEREMRARNYDDAKILDRIQDAKIQFKDALRVGNHPITSQIFSLLQGHETYALTRRQVRMRQEEHPNWTSQQAHHSVAAELRREYGTNSDVFDTGILMVLLDQWRSEVVYNDLIQFSPEYAANASEEADYYAAKLRDREIGQGQFRIYPQGPGSRVIRKIEMTRGSIGDEANPLLNGFVVLSIHRQLNGGANELSLPFNLSKVNGDFSISPHAFNTPRKIFEGYGFGAMYQEIRRSVLAAIYAAVESGEVKSKSISNEFNEKLRARAEFEAASKMTQPAHLLAAREEMPSTEQLQQEAEPKQIEEPHQPAAEEIPEQKWTWRDWLPWAKKDSQQPEVINSADVVEPIAGSAPTTPTTVATTVSEKTSTIPEEKDWDFVAQQRQLRTLSYDIAIRAFERLGVEVVHGGRHVKLRYTSPDGNVHTVPFVNPHSGKSHEVGIFAKKALKQLGISQQDFLDAL